MVMVDEPAYRDVVAARFLTERFGRLKQKRADSSVAGSYATVGIAGDNSLIELFGTAMPGAAPLRGGIVLSFEEPGSAPDARAMLDASEQVAYHHQLVLRTVEGVAEPQPWYHLISVDLGAASTLLLFANEVTPEYFDAIGARPGPDGLLRRRDYLDAALGAPADGRRMMRDIVGVTLVVGPERAQRITAALCALGFEESVGAGRPMLVGPDLTVSLRIEEAAHERVGEIELRISESTGGGPVEELAFGTTSRLIVESSETARWIFDPIG